MTLPIKANWRQHFGPGGLKMPNDGHIPTMVLAAPWPVQHEDTYDSMNADGTAGPADVGGVGGSGICFGYANDDIANVVMLDDGTYARHDWYNWEHWIRQIRYTIARSEMTRDLQAWRRIIQYANHAKDYWDMNQVYDGPGWVPDNVNQYLYLALKLPHTGSPVNCRALGWVIYGEAMAHKIHPSRDRTFLLKCLQFLDTAAMHGSGQIGAGPNTGGDPLDQTDVQYAFHTGILIHGVLCACKQLGRDIPQWVLDSMNGLDALPLMPYYGAPSMAAFSYTVNGELVAATGPGQHGDPAFAHWSSNCVLLDSMQPGALWLDRARRWGPTTYAPGDQVSRYYSMLYRGATA
jgi:hypothetical protein